jgi:hypothetical protein
MVFRAPPLGPGLSHAKLISFSFLHSILENVEVDFSTTLRHSSNCKSKRMNFCCDICFEEFAVPVLIQSRSEDSGRLSAIFNFRLQA